MEGNPGFLKHKKKSDKLKHLSGKFCRYSVLLDSKLRSESLKQKAIVHYTKSDYGKLANAAYLAGAFAVMFLNLTAEEVWKLLTAKQMRYVPFRDASYSYALGLPTPTISILDCLRAIEKAVKYKFVNFKDFDFHHYGLFEVQEYSELNWIVPEKLIAFCNPGDDRGSPVNINRLVKYFILNNVGIVVRLNKPDYNARRFSDHGIRHVDLIFDDGTPPPIQILQEFLSLVENSRVAIAVHCKAGLGRTGCLIGAYIVKHYKMTASEAIAWMRICRPGMVVGIQNQWLKKMEDWLWREGNHWRLMTYNTRDLIPIHRKGIYSAQVSYKAAVVDSWINEIDKSKNERLKKKMQRWTDMFTDKERPLTQGDYLLAVKKIKQGAEKSFTR